MNALTKQMSADEFLAWAEAQPKEAGRFELIHGRIVEKQGPAGTMNAERSQHWRMKAALYRALHAAMMSAKLQGDVVVDGASVRVPGPAPGGRMFEPDVLVYLGPRVARDTLVVENPIIVAEILSPSTAQLDLADKVDGYFAIPSVQHYLVGDPDTLLLIHHARGPADSSGGSALLTRVHRDRAGPLILTPPGLTVTLNEVLEP